VPVARPGLSASLCARTVAIVGALLFADDASAHATARGSVFIELDDTGHVRARLEVTEQEILDLFDVDAQNEEDARRLHGVLEAALPNAWRFSGDGEPCAHRFVEWKRRGVRTIVLTSEARCARAPKELTVEWGLSAISTLDLVAVTTITAPEGIRHTSIFARQNPKETFVVAHPSAWTTLTRFAWQGVVHIATGFDHLAFLLALLLGCATWRRAIVVVTAFTLAHSLTLALGATGLVQFPSSIVESVIALSITVAALTVFSRIRAGRGGTPGSLREDTAPDERRVAIEALFALGFGLIHGLGFASMLMDALGQEPRLLLALFAFNAGVEVGQLVAVVVVFPLALAVGKTGHARLAFQTVALVVAALGLVWTIERVAGG